jgi:hypothetical protein
MADGFTLKIDDDLARDLERRAEAAGLSREQLALQLLQQDVINYDDYEWIGDDPRATPVMESDADGSRPWPEVRAELVERFERRIRDKS